MATSDGSLKASGGFGVIIGCEVLVARRDLAAFDASTKRKRSAWLALGCFTSAVLFALELVHQYKISATYSNSHFLNLTASAISLLATGFPLGLVLNFLFLRSNSVHIDREKIEIECPRFGRKSEKLQLQKRDINEIGFVDEGLSWLGFPSYISINALGRKFNCLQGIAAAEAGPIIAECRRLGYKTAA